MAETKNNKKDNKKKEEVHEVFTIENGETIKLIEAKGEIEKTPERKEEIVEENKLLRNVLIFIGVFLAIIILIFVLKNSANKFSYDGVKFDVIEDGELTFYHTSFPVIYNKSHATFNIYLRNDPRKLDKTVPAPKTPIILDNTVINFTEEFNCNGDGVIAIANMRNLYNAMEKRFIQDENASCDPWGRYMYIVLKSANETSVEKFGPNCYNININNCEILQGTEMFMDRAIVQINSELKK